MVGAILGDDSLPCGTGLVADTVDDNPGMAVGVGCVCAQPVPVVLLEFEGYGFVVTRLSEAAHVVDEVSVGNLAVVTSVVIVRTGCNIRNAYQSGRRFHADIAQGDNVDVFLEDTFDRSLDISGKQEVDCE